MLSEDLRVGQRTAFGADVLDIGGECNRLPQHQPKDWCLCLPDVSSTAALVPAPAATGAGLPALPDNSRMVCR